MFTNIAFFKSQKEMFNYADENDFKFYFSFDKENTTNKGAKEFGCAKDLDTFLDYYSSLNQDEKHFYELLRSNTDQKDDKYPVYEHYDLDIKIPIEEANNPIYSDQNLFIWFDYVRHSFVEHNIKQFVGSRKNDDNDFDIKKPDWIILTASNHEKLSLHLINRNSIFETYETLRAYFSLFKTYFKNFYTREIFDIDFSIYTRNRNMRIVDSTKLGSDRVLKVWKEYHQTYVDIKHTFISDANNADNFFGKLICYDYIVRDQKEKKNDSNTDSETRIYEQSNDEIIFILSLISTDRCDEYQDWIKIGMALKNDGYQIDIWKNWSKQSKKYDESYLENAWNNFTDNNDNRISSKSIYYYAKEDNLEKYNEYFGQKFKKDNPNTSKKTNNKFKHVANYPITDLLDILSKDRIESMIQNSYTLDIELCRHNVAAALIYEEYPFEIWRDWCNSGDKTFDEVILKDEWTLCYNKKRTLGTIMWYAKQDNYEKYFQFRETYTEHDIDISFSPNIVINSRFIDSSLYKNYLQTHDVVCLKSNLNTGKTFSIPRIFDNFKKIVVVYHRISLSHALYDKWIQYGFDLYQNIQGSINLNSYNRIIVQIDSLHRIQGKCDLLILDEIESAQEHLCSSSHLKERNIVFNTLMDYVNKDNLKVIVADGTLKDSTCNILFKNRDKDKIVKIENVFRSFSGKTMNIFTNFKKATLYLIDLIKNQKKKVAIPTNSKKNGEKIHKLIQEECGKDLKILRIDSDNSFTTTSNWIEYDILIYSPTITAGISFEEIHFDHTFGFFINSTTTCESSLQMLFRVRNTVSPQMYLYCVEDAIEPSLSFPTTDEDITNLLCNKIKIGHKHLIDTGLEIDRYEERVKKNTYFHFYKNYLKKRNFTRNLNRSYLTKLLREHGLDIYYNCDKIEENKLKEFTDKMKDINDKIKEEEAHDIYVSKDLELEEYLVVKNKKSELTREEKFSIKKYQIKETFEKEDLTFDFIKKNGPLIRQYKMYKEFKDLDIGDAIEKSEVLKEISYDEEMEKSYESLQKFKFLSESEQSDSDDGTSLDSRNKNLFKRNLKRKKNELWNKKNIHKTVDHSIHYDRTYYKLAHVLQFIKVVGFKSITDIQKIRIDFEKWFQYIKENDNDLIAAFGCKKMDFDEQYEEGDKQSIAQYVSAKIRDILGINIKKTSKNSLTYYIEPVFKL